jgi:hypothetical protein
MMLNSTSTGNGNANFRLQMQHFRLKAGTRRRRNAREERGFMLFLVYKVTIGLLVQCAPICGNDFQGLKISSNWIVAENGKQIEDRLRKIAPDGQGRQED